MLASGDGGFLMGLADLESLISAAGSAVIVIYSDAAYGAESAIIRSLADLSTLQDGIAGSEGGGGGVARLAVTCLLR